MPFLRLSAEEARPFENCLPLYSLKAAAGRFGEAQEVEPEDWVAPNGRTRPAEGLFVAQVVGESMNRRIPNGAHCVFRTPVEGSRNGRVLLVQHCDIADPETGGSYTVKVYERDEGRTSIFLKPTSSDASFEPTVLTVADEAEVRVIAELVEVLPGGGA